MNDQLPDMDAWKQKVESVNAGVTRRIKHREEAQVEAAVSRRRTLIGRVTRWSKAFVSKLPFTPASSPSGR